ncbi:MAG: hypothetical protein ACWA5A_14205 [Marinibacterium sp.]
MVQGVFLLFLITTALAMMISVSCGRQRAMDAVEGPLQPKDWNGGHIGVWAWGAFLVMFLFWLLVLLASAVNYGLETTNTGVKDCAPKTPTCDLVRRWYVVMTDWQSGIGATIGLLGVAWGAFFKSVYGKNE